MSDDALRRSPLALRRMSAIVLCALVVGVGLGARAGAATPLATPTAHSPSRILVLSLPTLAWGDLSSATTPHLLHFLDRSAIADLSARGDRQPASLGAAYVTIGAGTRAAGDDSTDGDVLQVDERFGDEAAGQVYRQRTGKDPGRGLVDLGIARVDSANAKLLYDARPGALGDELASAGYSRAVIANADGTQPDTPSGVEPRYYRAAGGALINSDGQVPDGAIDTRLLTSDRRAPYGVRFDPVAVEQAFVAQWVPKSVVLVEGSDLLRADRFSGFVTTSQEVRQRRDALARTDRLIGRLLAHVDTARDAVIVVAPVPRAGDRSVTIAAVNGPGVHPGLLVSATTRRAGFVTLADIAPTVLRLLQLPQPASMEGRPIRVESGHGSAADRRDALVRANLNGLLRDDLTVPVTGTVLWAAMSLVVATVLVASRGHRARAIVAWLALAMVGLLLAIVTMSALNFAEHGGKIAVWFYFVGFAVGFAALCSVAGRRRHLDPIFIGVGALLMVLVVDQLAGSRLGFNSVFGYSATQGIRFTGLGNLASVLLSASAVLVAALCAWRFAPPHGVRAAVAVLAVSFVAITPPFFGQDFGGTLASAPAFVLMAWLLLGHRITVKATAALIGILIASGLLVGFLDLLRPSDQRTHVGRFFEKVGNEGFAGFATVIERKTGENIATFSRPIYLWLIVVAVVGGLVLWLRPPRTLATAVTRAPTLRPAGYSLAVLAVLSYALNDSGVSIPAVMMALVSAAGSYLAATAGNSETDESSPEQAPAEPTESPTALT